MAIDMVALSRPHGENVNDELAAPPVSILSLDEHLTRFVESLTLYTLRKTNVTSRITAARQLPDHLAPDAVDRFSRSIGRFIAETRGLGARPVLCTFAMSHNADNLATMPTDYTLGMLRQNPNLSVAGWVNTVKRLNQQIRSYGRNHGISVIDVEAVIGGQPKYFRDAVHFSPVGHAKVAELLANGLWECCMVGHRLK